MVIYFEWFTRLTRCGFGGPLWGRDVDMFHNPTWWVKIPLVGMVLVRPRVLFPPVEGREHLWAVVGGEPDGHYVGGCGECAVIAREMLGAEIEAFLAEVASCD